MKSLFPYLVLASLTQPLYLSATDSPNVIYGDDDRQDISSVEDTTKKDLARSVVLISSDDGINKNIDGSISLITQEYVKEKIGRTVHPLCTTERFYAQPQGGFCTGFLVAKDVIATAAHCLDYNRCSELVFSFDYSYANQTSGKIEKISKNRHYRCQEVLIKDSRVDFALIQLDRDVIGRTPLKLSLRSTKVGEDLFMIGHPKGLPLKVAGGAYVRSNIEDQTFFMANTDSYRGNSGSPVFNAQTNEVEGILVNGETDYVLDQNLNCAKSYECENDSCDGEGVAKIKYLEQHL